ncbi:MAG: aminotransferase class I/II-fold pyridoxal phosphate-dependent enzyme [Lachnospiraceae bacterium]
MNLLEELEKYTDGNQYPMHMPGHKRNVCLLPDYKIDLTEIDGFDNLHHPRGLLKECMDNAAEIYGSLDSFYVINGATSALHGAIYASTKKGDKVMVARNCHKSVYNMLVVRELVPVYVYGEQGYIAPADVLRVLNAEPDIKAAIITSPTYDGIVSDIKSIADMCHEQGVTLIVDEAHGAHLPFAVGTMAEKYFPESAMYQGADLVVQSLHKTLPAMTQTAILHRMSERVGEKELRHALSIFESSSPSYVLMASIDSCIRFTHSNREQLFQDYYDRLKTFYLRAKKDFPGLLEDGRINEGPACEKGNNRGDYSIDPGKILICGRNLSMTGGEIYDILLNNYGIMSEMSAGDYCLCMTSICDTAEGMERLSDALSEIYSEKSADSMKDTQGSIYPPKGGKAFCTPAEAEGFSKKAVDLEIIEKIISEAEHNDILLPAEGEGCPVCGGMISVYPPGAPVLVPGEYISKESMDYIKRALAAGNEVNGVYEGCIDVLAEG